MRLKPGMEAPSFAVLDTAGEMRRLEDYRDSYLMISFYRYAACPYCNLRIHQMIQHYEKWSAKGLQLLAFFQSENQRVNRIVGKQNVPFPMISEPQRKIYQQYGVESSTLGFLAGFVNPKALVALGKGFLPGKMEGDKFLLPADFLIGPELQIQELFYASEISQHMPITQIDSFVEKICNS